MSNIKTIDLSFTQKRVTNLVGIALSMVEEILKIDRDLNEEISIKEIGHYYENGSCRMNLEIKSTVHDLVVELQITAEKCDFSTATKFLGTVCIEDDGPISTFNFPLVKEGDSYTTPLSNKKFGAESKKAYGVYEQYLGGNSRKVLRGTDTNKEELVRRWNESVRAERIRIVLEYKNKGVYRLRGHDRKRELSKADPVLEKDEKGVYRGECEAGSGGGMPSSRYIYAVEQISQFDD